MGVIYNLDAYQIQQYQQNRYPLLFVDKITEAVPGEYAKGVKCFSFNEWYFPAHFEDEPNVPGFIQVEALTQVFLMTFLTIPEFKGKKTGFVAIKNARFKKKIIPGDALETEAILESFKRGFACGKAMGYVNREIACSIELKIAIPDIMNNFIPRNKSGGVSEE
ncbi:MAG: beta-hydroxyacyl-ACP dehydratase [Hungatella sp.]|nr:beta-hydroxyacyl-ACP dehydratase [Hungatella sp.]